MATSLADRLRMVLEHTGLSPYDLSKRAGLSGSHVANIIERDARRTSTETIEKIAKAAGVSEEWLRKGVGAIELVRADPTIDDPAPPEPPARETIPETIGGMRSYDAQEKRARKALKAENFDVDEWVWRAVRNISAFNTSNSAPAVSMLADLAKVIQEHGDPSVVPGRGVEGEE